ncbi:Mu-like prophage major head subunit gpT family protein [Megalodesulfovibrio gigas]|uniref:Putative Mu-like major head subunit gpT, prophage protein n=1 Tax=Megalodesulfovibrio gigas (strain ATCC 19364 / DSM 1382 / NCIMB 9332 / VKM B-1759) TaxID=1121448 RepID=T2GCW6_MEGG1|nr:Mu-like prophage major head subunit gpT family protein [Megalodesulfovibrio gigas]AGW14128.1 putative Mu-like major head subunit gpT, prophage protein [Megalodesulfovibrio gigas DSM 1382 = ATCC 19364]
MLVNAQNIASFFVGLNTAFQSGLALAAPKWPAIAMHVPSTSDAEDYGWLSGLPSIQRWVGDKEIKNLKANGYTLANEDFEGTFGVPRNSLADDKYGMFANTAAAWGGKAALWPDAFLFPLLLQGWDGICYDAKPFFSNAHPYKGGVQSNSGGGNGTPWFLLCTSQVAFKPLVFQEREAPHLVELAGQGEGERNAVTNTHTFMKGQLLYSVEARGAFGFGFWQLAYGSKQELNTANLKAARQAMEEYVDDAGTPLDVTPNLLVVPPSLRGAAEVLVNKETLAGGETNELYKAFELLVSGHLR